MLNKAEIKDIQSLALKKYREQSGCFLAEGPKLLNELLQHHRNKLVSVYALPEWIREQGDSLADLPVKVIDETLLNRLSQWQTPHQVLAVVRQFDRSPLVAKGNITIVCCGLQDPGNLGTIIRTADWFGVRQVVCSPDTADCYNPKVVQSTMGSLFRVGVHYLELDPWLDSVGTVPVFTAAMQGVDVRTLSPLQEGILLIGNESAGVPAALSARAQQAITIPGKGTAESLNAAVATGILLAYLS